MKTTDDIIDELRLAATSDPAPAGLSGLLTEAADRLDNLLASGVHTCHANCQRPMCVLRRKLKAAQAELAQAQESLASSRSAHDAVVKASQDEHQELVERRIAASKHSNEYNEQFFRAERLQQEQKAADAEFEQLRASLARVTAGRDQLQSIAEKRYEEFRREANAHFVAAGEIEKLETRCGELVAALDDLLGCPTVTDLATCPNGDPSRIDEAPEWQAVLQISCAWTRYKKLKALARSESATPLPMREDPRYRGTDFRSPLAAIAKEEATQ